MGKFIDLTGQKYGKLFVIERAENKENRPAWLCKCDCGNIVVVKGSNLRSGHTKSCGCFRIEKITTHDKTHTRLYTIWHQMKERCYRESSRNYKYYGARGIRICNDWKNDFSKFYEWAMKNGYNDKLTIDRINTNGNYEPSNCRWATISEQNKNRRPYKWKNK